jgi:HAMP domain-containing protein
MKLAPRLTLLFVLLSILPVVTVGLITYHNGRRTTEQVEINHLVSTNMLKSSQLNRWIEGNVRSITELAQRPLIVQNSETMMSLDPSDPAYEEAHYNLIQDHLTPRIKSKGGFLEISIIDLNTGVVLASSMEIQEGKYRTNQNFFTVGKNRTVVQGVYYSLPLQQPAITIATPIRDRLGNPVAVLAGLLDLSELSSIMSAQSGLNKTEYTYLVNKSNFFVTEPRSGASYALKKTVRTEGVEAGLAGEDGIGFYQDFQNIPVIGAYKWLPDYNMCIMTEVAQSEAYAPINYMAGTMVTLVVLLALIVVAASIFLARTISASISNLVAGAAEIGRGNLDHRVGTNSKDEIGELSRAFDSMAAELKSTTVSLNELEKTRPRAHRAA